MPITAIIATRDRQVKLLRCVANFIAEGMRQIIIVDQSPLPHKPFLERQVIYCHRPDITSASAARNWGATLASSPWLWFADDDCWLNRPFPSLEKIEQHGLIFLPWRRKNKNILPLIKYLYHLSKKNRFYGWLQPLTGTPFFIVKRELFNCVLFDGDIGPGTPYPTSEDLDFIVRFLQIHPHFALIDDNIIDHELHIYNARKWQQSIDSRQYVMERQRVRYLYLWKCFWYASRYLRFFQVRLRK